MGRGKACEWGGSDKRDNSNLFLSLLLSFFYKKDVPHLGSKELGVASKLKRSILKELFLTWILPG